MKQTFDTDDILYGILIQATGLISAITGSVYSGGERPDGSKTEDIVINTITLTQNTLPQLGTSNVNIHVPDMDVKISGKPQKKANKAQLKALTTIVLNTLTSARVLGLKFRVTTQTTIKEPELSEHFVNLRIEWSIH